MADDVPLAALWAAESVAVVGASERPGTPGRLVVEHLLRYGYPGTILPVNARDPGTVLGLPAWPSVIGAMIAWIVAARFAHEPC